MSFKSLAWRVFNRTGLGKPFSVLTTGRLQILCFHGFSFVDEHRFRGKLFMAPAVLEQRMDWLKRNQYAVLDLDDAVRRLQSGTLRRKEIVITIDDGFHSVLALAAPILRAYDVAATVYVTTYYMKHPNPIFRLAIQYMVWKSGLDIVELSGLVPGINGHLALRGANAAKFVQELYESAETHCTEEERVLIAREFGRRVGVDYDELVRSKRLSLMTADEVKALRELGFRIQLHTHRHHLPLEPAGISREIADNRTALAPLTDDRLEHFCYPSGVWDVAQWPTLCALGIKTATTCVPGFNSNRTPLLGLRRFLDGQEISLDEFGAEMLGVKDAYRRARRLHD
jgi:peptidoglycan/xylan/chitin deacetylase (PgdA/CDA1 family)